MQLVELLLSFGPGGDRRNRLTRTYKQVSEQLLYFFVLENSLCRSTFRRFILLKIITKNNLDQNFKKLVQTLELQF